MDETSDNSVDETNRIVVNFTENGDEIVFEVEGQTMDFHSETEDGQNLSDSEEEGQLTGDMIMDDETQSGMKTRIQMLLHQMDFPGKGVTKCIEHLGWIR